MREFWSPYVGMGNDPVNLTDSNGGCTGDCPPAGWEDGSLIGEVVLSATRLPDIQGITSVIQDVTNNINLDHVQTSLDVAGWIPGAQTVAGLTNAAIDIQRGNYTSAAINVASSIPLAGYLVKAGKIIITGAALVGAAKIIHKIFKSTKSIANSSDIIEDGSKIVEDIVQVRHHTSKEGIQGIKNSGVIRASRGEPLGVHVEVEPFLKPSQVNLGQAGTGAYVEFSISKQRITPNNLRIGTGNAAKIITDGQPLNIQKLNPKYVNWRW